MSQWTAFKGKIRHWFWASRLGRLGPSSDVSFSANIQNPKNIEIGRESHISKSAYLFGNSTKPSCLRIGNNTVIREGAYLAPTDGIISIGNDSFIGPYTVVYGNGHVIIGDKVLIAAHCSIASINHMFGSPEEAIAEQGLDCRPVTIEDNVWLGMNVTVVPGVRIGTGSVIAAGTVVYQDIPPNSMVRGFPMQIYPRIKGKHSTQTLPPEASFATPTQEVHNV